VSYISVFSQFLIVSCCSDAPLDLKIKSNMISDLFSLVGMSLHVGVYINGDVYECIGPMD